MRPYYWESEIIMDLCADGIISARKDLSHDQSCSSCSIDGVLQDSIIIKLLNTCLNSQQESSHMKNIQENIIKWHFHEPKLYKLAVSHLLHLISVAGAVQFLYLKHFFRSDSDGVLQDSIIIKLLNTCLNSQQESFHLKNIQENIIKWHFQEPKLLKLAVSHLLHLISVAVDLRPYYWESEIIMELCADGLISARKDLSHDQSCSSCSIDGELQDKVIIKLLNTCLNSQQESFHLKNIQENIIKWHFQEPKLLKLAVSHLLHLISVAVDLRPYYWESEIIMELCADGLISARKDLSHDQSCSSCSIDGELQDKVIIKLLNTCLNSQQESFHLKNIQENIIKWHFQEPKLLKLAVSHLLHLISVAGAVQLLYLKLFFQKRFSSKFLFCEKNDHNEST
eukprot:403348318